MKQPDQLHAPVHVVPTYLKEPVHPITITLVGVGGTGSHVLTGLASLHLALRASGHPGLVVTVFDPDTVSESNVGRQKNFSTYDIGLSKAIVLVERINRFYGLDWTAHALAYTMDNDERIDIQVYELRPNILITCVDNAACRLEIAKDYSIRKKYRYSYEPFTVPYYWLDLGNGKTTGQAVLGTFENLIGNKNLNYSIELLQQYPMKVQKLDTIIDMFPDLEKYDNPDDQGPSCSLTEAIAKQDLFINPMMAQYGLNLLWMLFKQTALTVHGVYVNLSTCCSNPIPIKYL